MKKKCPRTWLSVTVPKDSTANTLSTYSAYVGSEERRHDVTLYFTDTPESRRSLSSHDITVVEDDDWEQSWRKNFTPVTVAGHTVVPPWRSDEGDIIINPGRGFGTGQHETTRLIARSLIAVLKNGGISSMGDVGAGSGILSLIAVRENPDISVTAWETNEQAVENMRNNCALNNAASIRIVHTSPGPDNAPKDVVTANIISSVLLDIQDILRNISLHFLILSGIMIEERDSFFTRFDTTNFMIVHEDNENEWLTVTLKRLHGSEKR